MSNKWGISQMGGHFFKNPAGNTDFKIKILGYPMTWPDLTHTYIHTHIYIYIDKDFSTANGYKGLCCENKENSENQDHQGCERQKYNQPSFHLRIHVTKSLMMPFVVWTCLVIFGKCDGFPGTKQTYNIVSYRLTPDTPAAKGGEFRRNILVKWPISSPRGDQLLIMGLDKYYAFAVAITCYNYI